MRRMLQLAKFLLLTLFIISCRPEQEATDYGMSAVPQSGADQVYETYVNRPVRISFAIEETSNSMNLRVQIVQNVRYGVLSDCDNSKSNALVCWYVPNNNFIGEDYLIVQGKDGDFASLKSSRLLIKVLNDGSVDEGGNNNPPPRNNRPSVGADQVENTDQEVGIVITVSMGNDQESPAGDLKYNIVDQPRYGDLSNCFVTDGNRMCTYTPKPTFNGVDFFTYNVEDAAGLESNNNARVTINVAGTIFDGAQAFTAQDNKQISAVDITWVVDNSGSMKDNQNALRQNFASFIEKFLMDTPEGKKARYPFKMGVLTTEAYYGNNIKFREESRGNMYDLSSVAAEADYDKFVDDFKKAVYVGDNGGGNEKALLSAHEVYKRNSAWYGGNDTLSIYVIVSDEMEQSLGSGKDNRGTPIVDANNNPVTIERWMYEFQSLKDNPTKTRFFPIIDPNNDHGYSKGDNGKHYEKIANLSAGQTYNIFSSFDGILDNISNAIVSVFDSYLLDGTKNIIADSIQVYLIDPNTGQQTLTTDYVYENYSIKFNNPIPDGTIINVTYKYTQKYVPN